MYCHKRVAEKYGGLLFISYFILRLPKPRLFAKAGPSQPLLWSYIIIENAGKWRRAVTNERLR